MSEEHPTITQIREIISDSVPFEPEQSQIVQKILQVVRQNGVPHIDEVNRL